MNNKIKFLLILFVILFSVIFLYRNIEKNGEIILAQNNIEAQFEEGAFSYQEKIGDSGKILGAYEVGGSKNYIKFIFFVIFTIFFFVFLFWIIKIEEKEKQ